MKRLIKITSLIAFLSLAVSHHSFSFNSPESRMGVSTPTKGGSNLLPNLFNATGGQQVRLLPSASKHFAEFLGRSQTFTSPLNTRLLYESFNKGLNHAINLGLKYGEKVNVPGWEFIFQKARDGGLPVLIHALPK